MFEDFEEDLTKKVEEATDQEAVKDIERVEAWKRKRLGKITSSHNDDLMKGGKNDTRKTYLLSLLFQRKTGLLPEEISTPAMRWGRDHEIEALEYYNKITGNGMLSGTYAFDDILFIDNVIKGYGDSPDGITEDKKGRIEIKCPYNPAEHLRNFGYGKRYRGKYFYQCLGHLLDPLAEWCDFVSFDPRYEDGDTDKIYICRIWKKDVLLELSQLERTIRHCVEVLETGDKLLILNM